MNKGLKFIIAMLLMYTVIEGLAACNSGAPGGRRRKDNGLKNDTVLVKETIHDFLNWYKVNYKKANSFPFLRKDKAGNPMVNDSAANAYLSFLAESEYIAPRYRQYWAKFFEDKKIELRSNPVGSDVPEGFDLDLVLITQEPELVLNKIDSIRYSIVALSDTTAKVGLTWPPGNDMEYEIDLSKGRAGWLIDYIATSNYD